MQTAFKSIKKSLNFCFPQKILTSVLYRKHTLLKRAILKSVLGCKFVSTRKPTYWPTDPQKIADLIEFFVMRNISNKYLKIEEGHRVWYLPYKSNRYTGVLNTWNIRFTPNLIFKIICRY